VKAWCNEKYGEGGMLHRGDNNYLKKVASPWNKATAEKVIAYPRTRPPEWVQAACIAYIEYCVKNFGQWPDLQPNAGALSARSSTTCRRILRHLLQQRFRERSHPQSPQNMA